MPDPLIRAIRHRDRDQAIAILEGMRGQLPPHAIQGRIIAVLEHLAWEEGDAAAANWILRRAGRSQVL